MAAILALQLPAAASAAETIAPGGSVTLNASANGFSAPTFQWRKNGSAISGATTQTYLISGMTVTDAALYNVVATDVAGSVMSSDVTLLLGGATSTPSILTQPAPTQTAIAGSSATFSVTASGNPSPTFQWKKDGVAIPDATNATLTLSALTTGDSGTYVVTATNSVGSATSNSANLTVTEPTSTGSAPVIKSQPASSQTVAAGSSVDFSIVASGVPAPTFQWRKNGTNIAGATGATFSLSSVTIGDAATYNAIVSNASGAVLSDNATLVVQSSPVFTVQPLPQAVASGTNTKFTVAVSAVPGATLQWHKNGSPIDGATAAVLLLNAISSSDVGLYKVVATNAIGSVASAEAALSIAKYPMIIKQPVSQSVSAKANVTFSVEATGSPAPTYQWKKNGVAIAGATGASLLIKAVNKPDAAEYMVEVRNVAGWVNSERVTLTINTQSGRNSADDDVIEPTLAESGIASTGLVNLSVRANAGTGSNGLIVGFVIDGTASKAVLIRGVGPALRDFGVIGALADPQLALYAGADIEATNDDWSASDNAAQVAGMSARVGAFSLADRAADAALTATLAHGAYTVQVSGKEASSGVALVEVYDAASNAGAKLVNLSVRAYIGSGADVPSVGFVIAGTAPRRVMIRAVGPTLAAFGVTDAITDPQLELFHGAARVDQNDNWGGSSALGTTFARVGAFGFEDVSSKDAVLLTTLDPGAYTVVVSGVNGAKGVGLVEVYDAP